MRTPHAGPAWRRRAARALAGAAAALTMLLGSAGAPAQDVRPVPPLSGRVVDQGTSTLTPAQISALGGKLAALEKTTGSQVVVLLVPTTQPEDIAAFAQRVGDQWKIGRRQVGDGLLIVVAKNDRKVRIEVAKALEGAIPDLLAKRIITEQITPAFKAGDYAGGLNAAVDEIAKRIRGEALPEPQAAPPGGTFGTGMGDIESLMLFLFVAVPIAGVVFTGLMGRKLGALATGAGAGGLGWFATSSMVLAGLIGVGALVMVGVLGLGAARRGVGRHGGPTLWTGGGGGGGWSSGSSGGGFSSGGGGDFGGGGASGNW
jgi:uncharacterized protein